MGSSTEGQLQEGDYQAAMLHGEGGGEAILDLGHETKYRWPCD